MRSPSNLRKWLFVVFAGLILLPAALVADLHWLSPLRRDWLVEMLGERYRAEVDLKSFHATFFPAVSITGEGLALRRKDQAGLPPIASVGSFSVNASWLGVLLYPRRFQRVRLEGLVVNVVPRQAEDRTSPRKRRKIGPFVLDQVFADGTTLNIFSSKPGKPPNVFDIQKLRLQSAGIGQPMFFQATLTNPKPVGQIQSSGRFGPWNSDEPSQTPVSGKYSFQNADLSTIRGLAGILKSEGSYEGVLNAIEVQGETDTPDFALGISGHPVHLKTQFKAEVDGTRGDTILHAVTAEIRRSTIAANGEVIKMPGGKIIRLDVRAKPARLEDLLKLAVKSRESPMVGQVTIATKFDLHPGTEDITKRLKLDGNFQIGSARFTDTQTERKITNLSLRGQGKRGGEDIQDVLLDMQGHFVLARGVATFSNLSFNVPGASVRLHGTFDLVSQALDFEGVLLLQAKASQMTTGIKSLLLKPVDPFFEGKGAGMVLPIRIKGTKDQPSFGVEIGKVIGRKR
jgi:hypothetical protein